MNAVTSSPTRSNLISRLDPEAAALGLQMALAGTLAFFFALVLRLNYPVWSVVTVVPMLMAQYAGAIQEKSVLRIIGTLVGGALGYLATAAWQQSPVLYLTTTFLLVTFCVAMFSQSRAPYAFFLTGLTFVVVASNGQTRPDMSWAFALARTEEVFIGVIASLVVQSLVFPNYANRSFFKELKHCFAELAEATPLAAARFAREHTGLTTALSDFPTRATALRTLLRFGGRESPSFRRDLPSYAGTVSLLARAANLLRSLEPVATAPEPFRSRLGDLTCDLGRHLGEGWQILQEQQAIPEAWKERAGELHDSIDDALMSLRRDPAAAQVDQAHLGTVSVFLLTLRELHDTLLEIDRRTAAPEAFRDRRETLALAPAWPDNVWLRHGVRAGIATVAALVLQNWLSPPGSTLMVVAAFVLPALNALSPEGFGDRGAFRYVIVFTLAFAGICLLLLVGSPLLASYSVLNIVLATWLFLLGYWIHGRGGITVPVQISLLTLISVLALNGQKPVSFEGIAGLFFGLSNALVISAVAQRLFWPVLPQQQLQRGLATHLRTAAACVANGVDHLRLWQHTKLGLFPSQARVYLRTMRGPAFIPEQVNLLSGHILTLQQLVGEIGLCAGRLQPAVRADLRPLIEGPLALAKTTLEEGLENLAAAYAAARAPQDLTASIDAAIAQWDACTGQLRDTLISRQAPPNETLPILGQAARYRTALALLRRATEEARHIDFAECFGDIAL